MANAADLEFAGQVALVTGGSSGIGFATARAFLEGGAAVAVCGRSAERGRQAAEALGAFGEVEFFAADVTDDSAVAALVTDVVARFGRIDHAFNNAANTEAATGEGGFTAMELAEFEGIVRASLTSVWLCMRHELPALLAGGGGSIVNTSSMDAQLRLAGTGSYAAAKSGVEALTVAAAKEFAAQGVRINAIRPGAIRTPMLERNLQACTAAQRQEREDRYRSMIAMRRIGEPSEIADAVLWLCSSRSSYVTGQVITVDGSLGL
ncbi:SDR family oxidoreductase [Phycicoccus sp. HDW14]|uniref:SDR family NAD(P)-dependent oxidoreductase n=1 Tax=Phycicoccus sp. HDW14 TaxID=2714941 RepID=UPI00140A4BF8|nr:SDR family NAD(P)-dependent oxidoreductase [Phycicoccus sp. HDW14]QIM19954.1 SDR family oxidoreductase [Phycicoccus sp. HDW14]